MEFDIVRHVCLFMHGKKLNLRDTVVVGFSLYPKFAICTSAFMQVPVRVSFFSFLF